MTVKMGHRGQLQIQIALLKLTTVKIYVLTFKILSNKNLTKSLDETTESLINIKHNFSDQRENGTKNKI